MRCFAGAGEAMACCAMAQEDCGHASVQQACCVVNTPDHGRPALASHIDPVKPPTVALSTVDTVWLRPPLPSPSHVAEHAVPTSSGRPAYLLDSTFRL